MATPSSSSEGAAEQGGARDNDAWFVEARIKAAFYPKFENDRSDRETRSRMIALVSDGLRTMEVTLKHSGSLFMYAGCHSGAHSKNSFGNIYTAVGVFILGRMFREAWGKEAPKMQAEFNDYLEKNRVNISMELVTSVLGDHGQRPKDDYAVVTAVTELGHGKPKFYSTPEVIAFCRKWHLPSNHVWLFSTRESANYFFTAYDALCEEGTATPVCKALDEIADISVPGSKDHVTVQGEILEGLVARIVSRESSVQLEQVLRNFSQPPLDGVDCDLGPSLQEICAPHRFGEKQKIKALLQNVESSLYPDHSDWFGNNGLDAQSQKVDERSVVADFLQAHPTDYATTKLQEMIRLMEQMKKKRFSVSSKCYQNYQKVDSLSIDNFYYKMVIHVHSDSVFTRYQQEMKKNQGLWPLYRGFFIDVNLFKANNNKATELSKESSNLLNNIEGSLDSSLSAKDGLADEDSNLMVKLKFLPYKTRTFLIRDGIPHIFKDDRSAYRDYYLQQMEIWGTSESKQKDLCELLNGWAAYIRGKFGNKPPWSSTYLSEANFKREYLSEAEPFLELYAKSGPASQALIRASGDLVQTNNFLAILDAQRDEEDGFQPERGAAPSSPASPLDVVSKTEGLILLFPGTDTNPVPSEDLPVFMFCVVKRVNHLGNLGKASLNSGDVLLKFDTLYDGKSRREFKSELYKRFGSLVKMSLLKPDRVPLPGDVKSILDEGLSLFRLHRSKRGRGEPSNGSYAREEWKQWGKRLREILDGNDNYLKSIQVPFDVPVKVVEQLKTVAKGAIKTLDTAKRRLGNIIFAAVTLSQVAEKDTDASNFLNTIKLEDNLNKVHVTLAHKRAHGVAAIASYAVYQNKEVLVSFDAFFYNDKMAALQAQLGMVNGEAIVSRNDCPHGTLWTASSVGPKEANILPQLVSEGKAKRVQIDPPITISGVLDFF